MNFRQVKPLPRNRSLAAESSNILHRMITTASLEVLARDIVRRPSLLAQIEPGTEVFVPFPPTGSWNETLAACRLLSECGCNPVPHLPARRVQDRDELTEWARSLEISNIRTVMLIAGDVIDAQGCFNDTLEILNTKILATHGIEKIGVAIYPDGHPYIDAQDLDDAFNRKLEMASRDGFALKAVTQFGYDASPLLDWLARTDAAGLRVPVSIGVAGPTKMKTLVLYAAKCGVAHSVKGVFAKPNVLRMLGQWDPLQVLSPVAEYLSSGVDIQVENAHIFTFGGLRRVTEWRERVVDRCKATTTSITRE